MSEPTDNMATLAEITGLRPMKKPGLCTTGCQAGAGRVLHIASGLWGSAICGTRPGERTMGWVEPGEIDLPMCRSCENRLPAVIRKAVALVEEKP